MFGFGHIIMYMFKHAWCTQQKNSLCDAVVVFGLPGLL